MDAAHLGANPPTCLGADLAIAIPRHRDRLETKPSFRSSVPYAQAQAVPDRVD